MKEEKVTVSTLNLDILEDINRTNLFKIEKDKGGLKIQVLLNLDKIIFHIKNNKIIKHRNFVFLIWKKYFYNLIQTTKLFPIYNEVGTYEYKQQSRIILPENCFLLEDILINVDNQKIIKNHIMNETIINKNILLLDNHINEFVYFKSLKNCVILCDRKTKFRICNYLKNIGNNINTNNLVLKSGFNIYDDSFFGLVNKKMKYYDHCDDFINLENFMIDTDYKNDITEKFENLIIFNNFYPKIRNYVKFMKYSNLTLIIKQKNDPIDLTDIYDISTKQIFSNGDLIIEHIYKHHFYKLQDQKIKLDETKYKIKHIDWILEDIDYEIYEICLTNDKINYFYSFFDSLDKNVFYRKERKLNFCLKLAENENMDPQTLYGLKNELIELYVSNNTNHDMIDVESCPISLEEITNDTFCKTQCGHVFNIISIIKSLTINEICPICRNKQKVSDLILNHSFEKSVYNLLKLLPKNKYVIVSKYGGILRALNNYIKNSFLMLDDDDVLDPNQNIILIKDTILFNVIPIIDHNNFLFLQIKFPNELDQYFNVVHKSTANITIINYKKNEKKTQQ
jgi:hypothetical protein